MSDTETERTVDVFAEIASQRQAYREEHLIVPEPPDRPDNSLPLYGSPDSWATFDAEDKVGSPDDVGRQLSALRERYEPFLQDHAPALPAERVVCELDSFHWREETEEDRRDFANVLEGAGDWETVQIPHYGEPLGRAVTYYRATFDLTEEMQEKERLFICFDGVDYEAHVFVNGSFVGSHEGFFAPFEFEFTEHARPGKNTLVVRVENDAVCKGNNAWGEEGDRLEGDKIYAATGPGYDDPRVGWHHCPPGMGIYQDVRVEARSTLFVHDLFVRPVPEEDRAEAWVELWNCDIYRRNAGLKLSVFGQNFETDIVEERQMDLENPLGPGVNYYRVNLAMPEHRRWEPESPWLYQLQARLHDEDGELLDTSAQQFGMRSFRMGRDEDREGRMYLNGREIRLRGANTMGFEQQDVMREDWDQLVDDILLAKVCNMNYWRLTQRPVQEEVYEYCDRLGLMTQTDLPLFGVLRRNQFCEAVRQAEEMERLVRAHPCNIMDTYINEPFPEARGKQHRHLAREELERFFSAADKAVYQANPDRVIKPVDGDYDPPAPGLPDNHCYCGWYNGHGVDIGRLHRGFWQQVKAGWMYGCGEFGAEGLEDAGLMRRHYPEEWLPQTPEEEAEWSPGEIVRAQTGRFHYMWFDAQQSVEDWVETSQEHQAWATRIMTEAFRRDERMNSFAIHLFIDAFPSGWMKAIMDVERRPKKAFYVYRDLLKPLIVSLRADRTRFFGGEMAAVEAWICNDTHKDHPGARLAYRVEMDEQTIGGGSTEARVPECSSRCQGKIQFELPPVKERKTAVLRLALIDSAGTVLHHTCQELDVFADPEIDLSSRRLVVVGSPSGPSARLVRALGAAPEMIEEWDESAPDPSATTVLVDSVEDYHRLEKRLTTWVENGAVVVLVEPEEGEHRVAGTDIGVIPCGMGHRHFVSRATGHPLVQGFEPDDFKFWYDARVGYKTPLLETTFTAKGWAPILTSGNGGFKTDRWRKTLAAAELPRGAGRWRICNLRLADRIQDNPVAETFAQRLLLAR